jgi:hypothetical protein
VLERFEMSYDRVNTQDFQEKSPYDLLYLHQEWDNVWLDAKGETDPSYCDTVDGPQVR